MNTVSQPASQARRSIVLRFFGAIGSAWQKWTDPTCPYCGHDKSCDECRIENNA